MHKGWLMHMGEQGHLPIPMTYLEEVGRGQNVLNVS